MSEPADGAAADLVRLWFEGDELHCVLDPKEFEQPDAWGVVLADVVRHLADVLHEQAGADKGDVVGRIRAAFDADLDGAAEAPG
jgi:hypothetical protein